MREWLIGWRKAKPLHPLIFEKFVPLLLDFPATWLVEAGISAANDILTPESDPRLDRACSPALRGIAVFLGRTELVFLRMPMRF